MYVPLARKWGVSNFEGIVGQPIVVKILKNSLYRNQIFSVYLFAGKHGCGKTSTARLFSIALNCKSLLKFQNNPQEILPCKVCDSCIAMYRGNHPDFVEIDAASHTGVDNVRALIDSATLLPLLGEKKIYLIDEAHMLSKAACNAFLKILEEPPINVVFILATTAPEKILETVRSRCFQLFFKPISRSLLVDYLAIVCDIEKIQFTKDGLGRIADHSGGSVRDSLNLLDQARLITSDITLKSLIPLIGEYEDQYVISLLESIFLKDKKLFFDTLKMIFSSETTNTMIIFDRFVLYLRSFLWFLIDESTVDLSINLTSLMKYKMMISVKKITKFLAYFYDNEVLLKKVHNPHQFFEFLLLHLIEFDDVTEIAGKDLIDISTPATDVSLVVTPQKNKDEYDNKDRWVKFLDLLQEKNDPLLLSVFKQGVIGSSDMKNKSVSLAFKKDFSFFATLIEDNKTIWEDSFKFIFGDVLLVPTFTVESIKPSVSLVKDNDTVKKNIMESEKTSNRTYGEKKQFFSKSKFVPVSNTEKLPYASMLQSVFRGTITEVERTEI